MNQHRNGMRVVAMGLAWILMSCLSYGQVVVAHRGASFDAPENTMVAFKLAFEQDADGIEGDFYVTSDGQVVCIHDADTKRTAGVELDVKSSTLAQLRALEYGGWKDSRFAGEPIPTFLEVVKSIPPGKLFVIELKTGPEIVPLVKQQIEQAARSEIQLLFIAFDQNTAAECKRSMPSIKTHWLTGFDKENGKIVPTADDIARIVQATGVDGVGMKGDRSIVDEAFLQRLRAGGVEEFHVWTIDSPDDAKFYAAQKSFGITTNRPAYIRKALQ